MSTTSAGQPLATQTERVPLSLNQEFVCLFDSGGEDGPFGPHYHIVEAWRVRLRVYPENQYAACAARARSAGKKRVAKKNVRDPARVN